MTGPGCATFSLRVQCDRMIPPILHYCWVGDAPLDVVGRKCLASWRRFCPGWTIREWRDDNLPAGFPYLQAAREHRMFSNVSNFVRLYAVHHFGGIYLDADAELIRAPDELLREDCFCGFQHETIRAECVNNAIFGAVPNHPFVKDMLERLQSRFTGLEPSHLSGPALTTEMLREEHDLRLGTEANAGKVRLGDITVFPKRMFAPFDWDERVRPEAVAPDTMVIHWWTTSWRPKRTRLAKLKRTVRRVPADVSERLARSVRRARARIEREVVARKLTAAYRTGPVPDRHDGVTLVCLVKDGELSVRPFIEHHFRLGVQRILFIDNGSTDRTVALAREYDNVFVFPLDHVLTGHVTQLMARRHVIERFCRQRWCLCLDVDELFDYPMSDRLDLASFVSYLEANSYTALVGQMLDMFADLPLNQLTARTDRALPLRQAYPYYDLAHIDQFDYQKSPYPAHHNRVSNPRIRFHTGGIRKVVFGTDQWLTKHPLFFLDGTLRPAAQQHWVTHASCADLSGVLYHYKFLPDFYARNKRAYDAGFGSSVDYGRLAAGYANNPATRLRRPTSRQIGSAMDLVEGGFLVLSDQYRDWVSRHGASSSALRLTRG